MHCWGCATISGLEFGYPKKTGVGRGDGVVTSRRRKVFRRCSLGGTAWNLRKPYPSCCILFGLFVVLKMIFLFLYIKKKKNIMAGKMDREKWELVLFFSGVEGGVYNRGVLLKRTAMPMTTRLYAWHGGVCTYKVSNHVPITNVNHLP